LAKSRSIRSVILFLIFIDKKFEEIFGAICLSVLVSAMSYMIAARYILNLPAHWAEEVSRFAFIWLIYVGAIIAIKRGAHFRVTAQFKLLPEKMQKYQLLLGDAIWLVYNVLLIKYGWDLVNVYSELTPAIRLPMKYPYSIIPFSFFIFSIRLLQFNYKYFLSKKNGNR